MLVNERLITVWSICFAAVAVVTIASGAFWKESQLHFVSVLVSSGYTPAAARCALNGEDHLNCSIAAVQAGTATATTPSSNTASPSTGAPSTTSP